MKYIVPVKIIAKGKSVVNSEALLLDKCLQIGLNEQSVCELYRNDYIVLDFGKEIVGSVRILTYKIQGSGNVRIRMGESVGEVYSDIGDKNATNNHSTRDFNFELQNFSDMTFNSSGFRFVRIDNTDNEFISFKSVVVLSTVFDKESSGKFISDDKLLNKIFDTAEYTIRCCIQNDVIWDGIKRDRLVWVGDMHPETLAVNCLFGELVQVKNSLNFAKEQSPVPNWVNGIPTYSLWWIIVLKEYYMQTGDISFLKEQKKYINSIIDLVNTCVTENGEVKYEFALIDWPTHPSDDKDKVIDDLEKDKIHDEYVGSHALTINCLNCAKFLLTELKSDFKKCDMLLNRLYKQNYSVNKFKQISGIRYFSGVNDKNDFNVLLKDGAKGMSTFMSYYILSALGNSGYDIQALDMLKEYYNGMLKMGATTFWEDFDLDWLNNASPINELPSKNKKDIHGDFGAFCYIGYRHSLCHGWSSGVIPYLFYVVGGIKILEVGCKKIKIEPKLSGLKSVEISYPTPYGVLKLKHETVNKKIKTTVISCPKEVEIVE